MKPNFSAVVSRRASASSPLFFLSVLVPPCSQIKNGRDSFVFIAEGIYIPAARIKPSGHLRYNVSLVPAAMWQEAKKTVSNVEREGIIFCFIH